MRVAGKLVHGPCLGDYPHIGADANGFYITTNEFYVFSPGFFTGAQIYGFSNAQLAAGGGTVNVVQFDTSDPTLGVQLDGTPGFTGWPAISTGNQFEGTQGGTEYFMSSEAVFQDSGADSRLRLWAVSNTGSLDSMPALGIGTSVINTIPYAVPGRSNQKLGDVPLATCLSTPGCWQLVTGGAGPFPHTEKVVDSNDSRIQSLVLANGKLCAALDTCVAIEGDTAPRAGLAFFVINPHSGNVDQQGYAGISGNNLTYPAIALTQSTRGVVAFTVLANDHYPSASYAGIDAKIVIGGIPNAGGGAGPMHGIVACKPPRSY